jgi:antitoxin component of RelBE/YafQ-DinJ toxin-antitoxin module
MTPGSEMPRLSFRLPESTLARLDALAAELGITRTAAVRRLIDAGLSDRPLPPAPLPTEDELLTVLGERARAGNTSAARSLLVRLEGRDQRADAVAAFAAMIEERRT